MKRPGGRACRGAAKRGESSSKSTRLAVPAPPALPARLRSARFRPTPRFARPASFSLRLRPAITRSLHPRRRPRAESPLTRARPVEAPTLATRRALIKLRTPRTLGVKSLTMPAVARRHSPRARTLMPTPLHRTRMRPSPIRLLRPMLARARLPRPRLRPVPPMHRPHRTRLLASSLAPLHPRRRSLAPRPIHAINSLAQTLNAPLERAELVRLPTRPPLNIPARTRTHLLSLPLRPRLIARRLAPTLLTHPLALTRSLRTRFLSSSRLTRLRRRLRLRLSNDRRRARRNCDRHDSQTQKLAHSLPFHVAPSLHHAQRAKPSDIAADLPHPCAQRPTSSMVPKLQRSRATIVPIDRRGVASRVCGPPPAPRNPSTKVPPSTRR